MLVGNFVLGFSFFVSFVCLRVFCCCWFLVFFFAAPHLLISVGLDDLNVQSRFLVC